MSNKYQWWREGRFRWDLVMMGDPDCHAYIVRYSSPQPAIYGGAWCWTLTMPRAANPGSKTYTGWTSAPHTAKRQVEKCIEENW
jgi:hypothetical protein